MKTVIIIASTLALGLFLISASYVLDNSNSSKSDTSNQGVDHVEEKIQMLSQLITNIKTPNFRMLKVLLFIVLV